MRRKPVKKKLSKLSTYLSYKVQNYYYTKATYVNIIPTMKIVGCIESFLDTKKSDLQYL